jgi:D-alanyl-D-alanine endopeptidase (penicillin-binding protein 7)
MVIAASGYVKIRDFTTTRRYRMPFRHPRYALDYINTNPLVRRGKWEIDLSKTGFLTEAGRCLVLVTEVGQRQVVMVLLDSYGTKTPVGDAGRIRRWIRTGSGGPIAKAAWQYQKEKGAGFEFTAAAAGESE